MWLIVTYVILVIITGYSSLDSTTLGVSISGFIAPLIALFGGSGVRGSLYGTISQKIAGLTMGAIFLVGSLYWISLTGFYVNMFNVIITGKLWVLTGFVVGVLFTSKKYAEIDDPQL